MNTLLDCDDDSDSDDLDYVPSDESGISDDEICSSPTESPTKVDDSVEKDKSEADKRDKAWQEFLKEVEVESNAPKLGSSERPADTDNAVEVRLGVVSTASAPVAEKPLSKATTSTTKPAGDAPSTVPPAVATKPPVAAKRPGGLAAVLRQIDKKPKLTILDKTARDWEQFKHVEGISEELKTFNKGRKGFVEKQQFLARTDQRQFEIERDIRLKMMAKRS